MRDRSVYGDDRNGVPVSVAIFGEFAQILSALSERLRDETVSSTRE
jgi:hypothetical protein